MRGEMGSPDEIRQTSPDTKISFSFAWIEDDGKLLETSKILNKNKVCWDYMAFIWGLEATKEFQNVVLRVLCAASIAPNYFLPKTFTAQTVINASFTFQLTISRVINLYRQQRCKN